MAYDPNADTLTREPEPEEQPSQYDVAFQNDFNRRFLPSQGGYGGQPTGLPTTQAFTQPYAQPIPTRPAPEQPGALPRTALPTPTPRYRTLSLDEARDATPGETYGHSGVSDESRERGFFGDLWTTIQHGGGGALEGVLGAARYFEDKVGADPSTKAWTDQQRDNVSQWMDKLLEEGSPSLKRGLSASMFGGVDAQGNHIPTPGEVGYLTYMRANVINLIPDIAMTLLPAALVGRLAIKAMSLVGAATKVARAGGVVGEMGTFGLQNMGEQYNSAVETLKNTPEATMMQSPAYAEMRRGGYSDTEAKELLKKQAIDPMMLEAALVGAAAGQGAMSLAARGVLGKLGGKGRLLGAAVGGGEGAALMGGQGGANVAIGQQFQQGIGTRQEFDQGAIARGVASGALTGAVIGAAGGALHPVRPEALQVRPPEGVPPDAAAALGEALGPPPPPPPPAFDPTTPGQGMLPGMSGQGEMFTEGQAGAGQAPREPAIAGVQPGLPPEASQGNLFDPTTQVRPPAPTQGEMFPREPPPPNTPVEPPPAAPRGGAGAAPPKSTPPVTPGVKPQAPGERPSKGKTKSEMVDVLVGEYGASPTQLKNMSPNDVATRYDREERRKAASTPTPPTSTVEPGVPASRPERSEGLVPPRETVAPPVPETSLPSAPATERPSTAQADLEARMRSSAETLRKTRETVAAGPTEEELATLVDTKQRGKTTEAPEAPVPVEEPAVEKPAATVSKGRKKQPTVIIPEKKAGPQAYVEREEGAPAPSAEELQTDRAKELARSQARDDVEVARKAAMGLLPPSTPIGKAIDKASNDLANLIHRGSDGSRENLVDILHKFTEPVDKRTELDQQAREKLADHYHRKLMGERLVTRTGDEPTRSEASVVREEEQKRGKVDKPTSAEGIEETAVGGGEGESAGLTMALDTKNKPVTVAHVQERKAADYIQKILDPTDPMTVEQAQAEFDKKGTVGRPRNADAASLAAALDAEIKRVSNPLLAETHQKQLDAHLLAGAKKDMPGAKQKPRTAEAAKEAREKYAERTKILEDRLAQVAPERIAALKEARARIVDPVGTVADQAQAMATRAAFRESLAKRGGGETLEHAPTSTGIDPTSANSLRVLTDSRLTAGVEHAIRTSEQYDVPFTDQDLARNIMQDPLVIAERPDLAALARQLYKLARGIPVVTAERGHELGYIGDKDIGRIRQRTYGHYEQDPGLEHIMVNLDLEHQHGTHLETALHEMVHSAFFHYIETLRQHDPGHKDLQALHAIAEALREGFSDKLAVGEFGKNVPETKRQAESIMYALSNEHELHTMLMTNADLWSFANSLVASDKFRKKMTSLGMQPRPRGRSVWSSFVDLVRDGLGLRRAQSGAEYTLLDHIMQPVTDIAQRAAKFNEKYLHPDPRLRADSAPLAWSAHEAFGERASHVAERTLDAVGDNLKPGAFRNLLSTIHFDRLIDRFRSKFQDGDVNHAVAIRTAQEHAQVASDRFLRKFAPRFAEVARELVKHDDVAELMNDAGYARAALGTREADANAHLTTPDERAQLSALQSRFDAMTPEKQALYVKTRDLLTEKYAVERQAVADNLVNRFMPNATDAEKALMRHTMASKERLDAFLSDPDNAAIAQDHKRIARGMAKLTRMGFVDGDYFPMRRYGDFVVEYGGQPGDPGYGVQFFEKPSEAAAFRNKQLADGVADVQDVRERNDIVAQRQMRLSPVVDEMIAAVRRDPALRAHANALEEMAAHLQMQYASGQERATARRRYVAGASKDVARALGTDLQASGRRIGTIMHGGERDAAFERMKAFNDQRAGAGDGDSVLRDQLYHELRKRFQNGDELNHAGGFALARKVSAFGYAQSMMSLSRVAVEAAEMHMKMAVFIGARHGFGRAALELSRSLKDLAPSIIGKGARNTLDALIGKPLSSVNYDFAEMAKQRLLTRGYDGSEVNRFFKHFTDLGLFGNTEAASLRELSRPTTAGNLWDRFLEISSATTHASDEMSRISGAWAAFRTARGKGEGIKDAMDFAENTLRKAPNYSVANRARITTEKGMFGRAAAPIMQFKQYGLNETWLIANLMRDSFGKGVDPAVRKEAFLQFTGTVMMHSLMAGALTWVADPVRYLGGAYDLATGHKPKDRVLEMRQWLAKTIGPTLGEIVGQGVPHLFGADMSHRLGVNNMLNIPQLNGYSPKDFAEFGGHLMLGAAGEDVGSIVSGMAKMMDGELRGGAVAMLPRILRDPVKAYGLATKGAVDARGKQILAPSKISPLDVAYQAVGIAPSSVSEARMGRQAIVQARDHMNETRSRLVQRWLEADPGDRAAVMSDIRRFNADGNVNFGSKITHDQLLQQLNERRKGTLHPGAFGLRLPKAGERQLMETGSFANH